MAALAQQSNEQAVIDFPQLVRVLRNGVLLVSVLSLVVLILTFVLKPLTASVKVEETVTTTLAQIVILVLPYAAYISSGSAVREQAKSHPVRAVLTAVLATLILFAIISAGHSIFE
jgi:hypothetical protein